jgi:hypothetical protein
LFLFGPLLLNLLTFFSLGLLLLEPGRVVLNPYILLDLPLFLIEDKPVNLLRVYIIHLFIFLGCLRITLAFLVHLLSVIAVFLIVRVTVLLVALSCLLELSLHSSDLLLENLFGNVKVLLELFPWNFVHFVFERHCCQLVFYLFLVLLL